MKSAHVALLRGVNVAGKNRLPMKDLVAVFTDAGCGDVRTYIQSGNVVFTAGAALAARVGGLAQKRIAERFGLEVPVVVRSAAELAQVARGNPFLKPGADFGKLMVMFLDETPSAERVATLDPKRSPPDTFAVRGREIYLLCPNGFGRSKLSNSYFDAKLATTSTGRNWRTVLELLEMTSTGR